MLRSLGILAFRHAARRARPLLAVLALSSGEAAADEVADFYKGRTLQVIVGYGPGGGNDVYARLLARHMGRHIPGNPALIVQNMPGAGSLVAANTLANISARDGTTFGTFARNLPLASVVGGNPNIRFDARKLTWLGSASSYADDAYILWVRPDAAVRSIEAARREGGPTLVLAGTAEGDTSYDVPVLLRTALGLHIRLVGGYRDSSAMFLAVEQREVDGRVADLSSVASSRAHWLAPGGMLRLVQLGRSTRHPDHPDVPTAQELATTADARELIRLMEIPFALTRPYAAPPDVPAPRAQALQAAFKEVQADPTYLEEARRLKIDVSPIGAAEIAALLDRMAAAGPERRAQVRRLLGGGKGG